MLSELFGLLSSVDVSGKSGSRKFSLNLNRNRIRSISAYSSNSIFYFPVIVEDQCVPEEVAMVSRMIEKSYASFVVACISLMPFHRIKADDRASIEEYLAQFHQNIGMNKGSGAIMGKTLGVLSELDESATEDAGIKEVQDFLLECWNESRAKNTDFIKVISETVSLNDMYNESAIDPKTRVLQEQYRQKQAELDIWGFIGEATDDLFDTDEALEDMSDEEIYNAMYRDYSIEDDDDLDEDEFDDSILAEGTIKTAIDNIRFSLEAVSENKIMSCDKLTKLSTLESKLKKLKNKYTKYLNRYKKKYKENQKTGSKSKLSIRFNNLVISNPKAFMKEYGTYIKIINKRLKLVDKRRAELRKRKGLKEPEKLEENAITDLTKMDFDALDYCDRVITEALDAPDEKIFILTEAKNKPKDNSATPGYIVKTTDEEEKDQAELSGRRKEDKRRKEENRKLGMKLERERRARYSTEQEAKAAQRRAEQLEKEQARREAKGLTDKEDFDQVGDMDVYVGYDRRSPKSGLNIARAAANGQTSFKTFDKQVFTDMDMKKANEAIPIFTKASIGFIVDETEEVVSRDVLIGIKAYIHRAPSSELMTDLYNCIINKRKFLRFVKFITGEERSLADLVFGFKELKNDALDAKAGSGQWRSAFKRRRRWAKMSIPYLTKEYTPNGTIVMTMNAVEHIKEQYGINIMDPDHVRMIMDADFLLGFVIVDQANEMVYVTYDGHGYGFQQYTYSMLEREQVQSDRMMRELYRSFSR